MLNAGDLLPSTLGIHRYNGAAKWTLHTPVTGQQAMIQEEIYVPNLWPAAEETPSNHYGS